MYRIAGIEFDRTELRDLGLAWFALAVAFTLFLTPISSPQAMTPAFFADLFPLFVMSLATVGSGFLLHELAHKVVAIRFGQIAAFRADYTMLGIAVASGLAGFLVAAPGAVYHRGRITVRQNGLVAVAGPVTNLVLAVGFLLVFLLVDGFLSNLARMGVLINVFLAVFNMIPFGPLDGRTVLDWSKPAFGAVLLSGLLFGAAFIFLP